MKTLLLLLFVLNFKAFAINEKIALEFKAKEVALSCNDKVLRVKIKSLSRYTQSKLNEVLFESQSSAVCIAVLNHLKAKDHLRGGLTTSIHNVRYYENEICNEDVCSAVRKSYDLESVTLSLEGISFKARAAVPGTLRIGTEEWNPRWCPPYAPDCDL